MAKKYHKKIVRRYNEINLSKTAVYAIPGKLKKKKVVFLNIPEKFGNSSIIRNSFTDKEIKKLKKNGLHNCSILGIAPSGSIGTLLNVTTGFCEPAFIY